MQKRVLFMTTEFPPGPGGIGTHSYLLALGLLKKGWQVIVLASQNDVSDSEIRAFNAVQPFSIVNLRPFRSSIVEGIYRFWILITWYVKWKPDICITSAERSSWLMAVLALVTRHPWIAIGHGTEFCLSSWWEKTLTRWAFNRANKSVSVSKYTRQHMVKLGIHSASITVIPNGADDTFFHPIEPERSIAFRCRFGLEHSRLLLTVGRVTERKGQEIVIRALPRILKSGLDVHYLIIGVPVIGKELENLARQLGVADRVHVMGNMDSDTVLEALNACDVFVMSSRYTKTGDFEGYGIAVIEAALCGKPSVVSGGSGLAEAVLDGETGLVVPQNDIEATSAAILSLLRNQTLYGRLAESARSRAQREQTWEHRMESYHALLCSILGTSNSL